MKKLSLVLSILFVLSIFSFALVAQDEKPEPPKKYSLKTEYQAGIIVTEKYKESGTIKFVSGTEELWSEAIKDEAKFKYYIKTINDDNQPKDIRFEFVAFSDIDKNVLAGMWFEGTFDAKKKFTSSKFSEDFPEEVKEITKEFDIDFNIIDKEIAVGEEVFLSKDFVKNLKEYIEEDDADMFVNVESAKGKLDKVEKDIASLSLTVKIKIEQKFTEDDVSGVINYEMNLSGKAKFNTKENRLESIELSSPLKGKVTYDELDFECDVKGNITFSQTLDYAKGQTKEE